MNLTFCENKKEWNDFILQNNGCFLQSFEWGELQQKEGQTVFRIKVSDNNEALAEAQITKESFSSKSYFYIAFGPTFKEGITESQQKESLDAIVSEIKKMAIKEGSIFLRIEPFSAIRSIESYKNNKPLRRIQPKKTLVIDLTKTEEEIFKTFSRTTKYNIGLAKRTGVTVEESSNYSPDFYNLLEKTKNRQEFGIYSEKHYKEIFKIDDDTIRVSLFSAKYENKTTNATIVSFFNKRATTLHAGSDYNYRNVKASNLLSWEIMRIAKKNGFEELDLWGIDEKKWPTLTSFKKGFGGYEIEYPEGVDIVFKSFWYKIYEIIKTIKK